MTDRKQAIGVCRSVPVEGGVRYECIHEDNPVDGG